MKRNLISSAIKFVYELFHKLPNKLRLPTLVSLLKFVPYAFTCQPPFRAYVPTGQHALRAPVPALTCLTRSRAHQPTYLARLRSHRAITSNNKNKFSMACFTQILGTFLLSFSFKIKLHMKSARQAEMSLKTFILRIQQYILALLLPGEAFNSCYSLAPNFREGEVA